MQAPRANSNPDSTGTAVLKNRFPIWLLVLALVLLTVLAYWPAMSHDFINYDDPDYVTANAHVQNGLTPGDIQWVFTHPVVGNWLPITMLSHMLDCRMFSLKPWGHHLVSVLWHAANTALVFLLLLRLTGATWRSFAVAALFGLHPLHVESVAWIAERKDVLSTFFGLLTLLGYAQYVAAPGSRLARSLSYSLTFIFFALGLMSKPMLVTIPCVMLLLDYWPLRRFNSLTFQPSHASTFKRLLLEKIPFFVLAAAVSVATYLIQQHGGMMQSVDHLPFGARVANALVSYCRYLEKLFWPANLAVFYPYPGQWPLIQVLLAGALVVGISILAFWQRTPYPWLLVGWFWFCGTLVPVIGLVQVGGQSMADRYAYIPSLGFFIIIAWGVYELAKRWPFHQVVLGATACVAIILCITLTRQQLSYWQNNETLYQHALTVTENNYLAHHNLGIALYKEGKLDEAIGEYRQALRIHPDYPMAHYDLGTALGASGQTDEAIAQFQEAIRLEPDDAAAHGNLGSALLKKGRADEALTQLQQAVKLAPDNPEFHYDLGTLLGMKGQLDPAIAQFQEAIRLQPDYAAALHNLAYAQQIKSTSPAVTPP